jgi:hypothetical protein
VTAAPVPTPIGVGPAFHPPALSRQVEAGAPVGAFSCGDSGRRFGVHLELFAAGRVVIVPAGIGVAPPWRRDGAYVRSGRCSYAVRTREPTGVLEASRPGLVLGDLFAIWGQRLGRYRRAYVDGRRWRRPLAEIPLRRHAEIVLEVGRFVPPHTSFLFRKGL